MVVYECQDCGHVFAARKAKAKKRRCSNCGSFKVAKVKKNLNAASAAPKQVSPPVSYWDWKVIQQRFPMLHAEIVRIDARIGELTTQQAEGRTDLAKAESEADFNRLFMGFVVSNKPELAPLGDLFESGVPTIQTHLSNVENELTALWTRRMQLMYIISAFLSGRRFPGTPPPSSPFG